MAEINREVGLDDVLRSMGMGIDRMDSGGEISNSDEDEKKGGFNDKNTTKEVENVG